VTYLHWQFYLQVSCQLVEVTRSFVDRCSLVAAAECSQLASTIHTDIVLFLVN